MSSTEPFRILMFMVCSSFPLIPTDAIHHTIAFGKTTPTYSVLEGDRVSFVCESSNTQTVNINDRKRRLVLTGALSEALSDEFEFRKNDTHFTLVIKSISRIHDGFYSCRFPLTSLILDVLYSPSEYPLCESNCNTLTFFEDEVQEAFNFSCVSEAGNPPINMMLAIVYKNKENKYVTNSTWTTVRNNSLFYLPHLNYTFNNTKIRCSVNQQLPDPYEDYNQSCEFGPLILLPTFSVSIHPPHYTLSAYDDTITLNCNSNLSEVTLEWTSVPLEDGQYNISRTNSSVQLNIFFNVDDVDKSVTFECNGSYGGRIISDHSTIERRDQLQMYPLLTMRNLLLLIIGIFVISVVVIFGINVLRITKGKVEFEETSGSPSDLTENTNTHRSNENNHFSRAGFISEMTSCRKGDSEMVENPVYASYSKNITTGRNIDNSISCDVEMTDNVIYESYEQKTASRTECMTDFDCAAVSI